MMGCTVYRFIQCKELLCLAGDGIGDVIQLLVWEINEIERAEVEKEPKDWPVGDEVMLRDNDNFIEKYHFNIPLYFVAFQ